MLNKKLHSERNFGSPAALAPGYRNITIPRQSAGVDQKAKAFIGENCKMFMQIFAGLARPIWRATLYYSQLPRVCNRFPDQYQWIRKYQKRFTPYDEKYTRYEPKCNRCKANQEKCYHRKAGSKRDHDSSIHGRINICKQHKKKIIH